MQVLAAFALDDTSGVNLQNLLHRRAEMVVQRGAFPYAHVLPAFLIKLIDMGLHDDAHTLHEEYTAQDRYHQLLMDDHGAYTDDAAYRQATRVAHEDLCREAVEPQITD